MNLLALFCYVLILICDAVNARIDWDDSCAPYGILLERHLSVARHMAKVALDALQAQPPLTHLEDVWRVLFRRDTQIREDAIKYFDNLYKIHQQTTWPIVTIFCNEAHLRMIGDPLDPNTPWLDTKWVGLDEFGNMQWVSIGPEVAAELQYLPRRTKCNQNPDQIAYTVAGSGNTNGEAHITICPMFFQGATKQSGKDVRPLAEIVTNGLSEKLWLNRLNNILPEEHTMAHELLHAIGGSSNPFAPGSHPHIGVLIDVCYGFDSCAATHISGGDTEHNVESYISFMLAANLQVKTRNNGEPNPYPTWWSLGVVDINTLKPPEDMLEEWIDQTLKTFWEDNSDQDPFNLVNAN